MKPRDEAEVVAFWADYAAATGAAGPYTAWGFADDSHPELMTKLGLLVRDGPKRATAGRPFGLVDAQFAWDEGEGDRTLEWWRAAHIRYFASVGTPIDDDARVVLERFAKVWPPPVDPPAWTRGGGRSNRKVTFVSAPPATFTTVVP